MSQKPEVIVNLERALEHVFDATQDPELALEACLLALVLLGLSRGADFGKAVKAMQDSMPELRGAAQRRH